MFFEIADSAPVADQRDTLGFEFAPEHPEMDDVITIELTSSGDEGSGGVTASVRSLVWNINAPSKMKRYAVYNAKRPGLAEAFVAEKNSRQHLRTCLMAIVLFWYYIDVTVTL
jgi:hypothetical protein